MQNINGKIKNIPGSSGQDSAGQIPMLAGLEKFVLSYTGSQATEDVASLEAPLGQVDEMLKELAGAFPATRQVDFDELMKDTAAKLPPSVDNYKVLAKATENYWNITKDPRDATGWGQKTKTIDEMIAIITESAAADDKTLPVLKKRVTISAK